MRTRPPWWISHQATRRPVSGRRQATGIVTAILIIVVMMAWRYVTDAERLRRYAETWLEEFSGGQAHVDRVEFNLFRGLNLIGVTIAVPESADFNPHDNSLESRTLFRCASMFLQLRPLSVVSGDLAVPEIVAMHPELRLVHRMADGVGNWQMMIRSREDTEDRPRTKMPVIRLRDARLSQFRLDDNGRLHGSRHTIWADAVPVSDRKHVYRLEVTKFMTGAHAEQVTSEFGYLEVDLQTLAMSASVPWISVEDLSFTAPQDVRKWLELLGIHGYVSSDYVHYEPGKGGQVRLILRDAGISIPIDGQDRLRPVDERYLRFDHVQGALTVKNREAHVRLMGRFHGAPIELAGDLSLPEGEVMAFEEMGFDMQVVAEAVTFPRARAPDDPSEERFVQRWKHFRNFIEDFAPRGQATLNARVNKQAGAEYGIEFVEGSLELHEISAAYVHFPYRFEKITGRVHWRPDRKVEIVDLRGRRGQATIHVEGLHQGYHSQGLDMSVQADDVPLDDYLLSHMSEADQELIRRFHAEARLGIALRIHRDDLPAQTPDNPPQSEIDATFLDGHLRFDAFNYPLNQLAGRLLIRGNEYIFDQFAGRRGPARVELNGRAVRKRARDVGFELDLEATDVPLDDTLATALPSGAREAYQQLTPSGSADVTGSVRSEGGSDMLAYDLTARLRELDLHITEPRMHLVEGEAEMRLQPGRVDVPSLMCRLGPSQLRASGSLIHGGPAPRFELRVVSPRLQLDQTVYEALPGAARAVWDDFSPAGEVRLDLKLANHPVASRPADPGQPDVIADPDALVATRPADESDWPYDYHLVIEPLDAAITYANFPLPLTDVTGRIEATPHRVQLSDVQARHDDSTIQVGGTIEHLDGMRRSELRVKAESLAFSESLRLAVPWRVRRLWNDVKPQGRFDLLLERVLIESGSDDATRIEMTGRAALRDVEMDLGVQVSGADGEVRGRIAWGTASSMDLKLALADAEVQGRMLTNLTGHLIDAPDENKMYLRELQADFYGGKLTGDLEVRRQQGGSRYGVTLNIGDVALAEFLNATRPEGKEPSEMKGILGGNLAITGRFGRPKSRRGGGRIEIERAELFKVPLMLAILQVIHFAIDDNNAVHDAKATFTFDGEDLILQEIDMRGRALSMVGAGRVHTPTQKLDIVLLVGSPLQLPRIEILSDLVEGVARELMEVHLEGTVNDPQIRADIVRSLRATLETILNLRRSTRPPP